MKYNYDFHLHHQLVDASQNLKAFMTTGMSTTCLGMRIPLVKATRKIKLVHEVDLVFDHSKHINKLLVTNRKPPEVTSVQSCFQNSLRQTSNFTWNEVNNWCNLTAFFSSR